MSSLTKEGKAFVWFFISFLVQTSDFNLLEFSWSNLVYAFDPSNDVASDD